MVVVVPYQGAGGNSVLCRYVPERLPGDERLVDLDALIVGADGTAPRHELGHVVDDDSQTPARARFGLGGYRGALLEAKPPSDQRARSPRAILRADTWRRPA